MKYLISNGTVFDPRHDAGIGVNKELQEYLISNHDKRITVYYGTSIFTPYRSPVINGAYSECGWVEKYVIPIEEWSNGDVGGVI